MGVVHIHRRARVGFPEKNLGPTMGAAGCGDKKIVVWDHSRVAVFYVYIMRPCVFMITTSADDHFLVELN